jgi:hypothetical protein
MSTATWFVFVVPMFAGQPEMPAQTPPDPHAFNKLLGDLETKHPEPALFRELMRNVPKPGIGEPTQLLPR